jgi:DNA-binding CsgD family transcriptional regulator
MTEAATTEAATTAITRSTPPRAPAITASQLKELNQLEQSHRSVAEIIQRLGITSNQVYKIRSMKRLGTYHKFAQSIKKNTNHTPGSHRTTHAEVPKFVPKLLQLRKQGMPMWRVAEKLNISEPMASYWGLKMGGKKQSHDRAVTDSQRQFRDDVMRLHKKGMTHRSIARELKVTEGRVWYLLKKVGMTRTNGHEQRRIKPSDWKQEDNYKAAVLRKTGMPWKSIGTKIGRHQSTVFAHKSEIEGAMKNGIITAAAANGAGPTVITATPPTKQELIGFAWAAIEGNIANISERTEVPAQILRRRLSELLAFEKVR